MAQMTMHIGLKITGTSRGAVSAVNKLATSLNRLNKSLNQGATGVQAATQRGSRFAMTLKNIQKGAMFATNQFINFGNSIRLAAQGMMSVGRAMTFFITPVILAILYKAGQAAIDFDDALVRVKKTTGATRKELTQIARGLRDLAVTTTTTAVDLAKISEQIGQVGVKAPKSIIGLTRVFNMLVSATDIAADKVGLSMGKIAHAFGIDLNIEEGVEQIEKLSSVINRLENDFAATAPEILAGLENLAQVGSILEMPPQVGAALVTALIDVGFSADEAGTGLRNLSVKMIQNVDVISQLMRETEGYNTVQETMNRINEDSAQVLIDMVHAASQAEDRAAALGAAFEAAGIRGGKGWTALAGGIETFDRALATADDEWENSLSLIMEYEESLLSTKSQLKVLRNNINEIALTLGDTLLPVMNHLIQVAVPGIRKFAEAFRNTSPRIKKAIVFAAIFVAALGPLVFFMSQVIFGLSMMYIGMGRLMQVGVNLVATLIKIGGLFSPLISGIAGFVFSWNGLIIAVAAGAVLLLMKFTSLGERVADFFFSLAEKASDWGESLIAEYGAGILSAAAAVLAKVLIAIGNFIARFLAGHSPPELGPLSHIGKWGQTVFDEYLKGFMLADFGILSKVGGVIEGILKNFDVVGSIGEGMQFKFAMEARQELAHLIDIFNETGEISQDVLNRITSHLGEAADEVQELIRLWLEYNQIQQELEELEKRREGVLDTYRQEIQLIAQSNMTAEEKADAIRQAMRARDEELKEIAEEEDALEEQSDIAKEQLDTQKAMVAAMQKQDDLQASMIKALDKLSSKLGGLSDFTFPSLDGLGIGEVGEDVEKLYEDILTLEERFEQGEKAFDGFFAALSGAPFDETLFADLKKFDEENGTDFANTYKDLWEAGHNLYEIWEKISGVWDLASGFFETLVNLDLGEFGENVASIGESLEGIVEFLSKHGDTIVVFLGSFVALRGIGTALISLGSFFTALKGLKDVSALLGAGGGIMGFFNILTKGAIPGAIGAIKGAVGGLGAGILGLSWPVIIIIGLVSLLIALFATKWDEIVAGVEAWKGVWENIKVIIGEVWNRIKEFFVDLIEKAKAGWEAIKEGAGALWEAIKQKIEEKIQGIIESIKALPGKIIGFLLDLGGKIRDVFTKIWRTAINIVKGVFAKIRNIIHKVLLKIQEIIMKNPIAQLLVHAWESAKEGIGEILEHLKEKFGPIFEDIALILSTIWERIKTFALEKWEGIKNTILGIWTGMGAVILAIWEGIKGALAGIWEGIKAVAINVWNGLKNTLGGIWEAIKSVVINLWNGIKNTLAGIWEGIKAVATNVWNGIKETLGGIWEGIKAVIGTKIALIVEKIKKTWQKIKTQAIIWWFKVKKSILEKWEEIKKDVAKKVEEVRTTITNFKNKFVQVGKDIISGIKDGVVSAAQGLIDSVAAAVQGALDWVKKMLGIASPSKIFMELGINTIVGMAQGIQEGGTELSSALTHTIDSSLFGALPMGLMGPVTAPASVGGTNISITFGRDSVRKEQDIDEITRRVKDIIARNAEDSMSMGTTFGGDL